MNIDWMQEFPGAVTVCDRDGIILFMNDKSRSTFTGEGDADLVGSSLLDCHPEPARAKLREMLAKAEKNVYTIEKKGKHKLIYQSPWYQDGEFAGLVEMSLEIPDNMPHFVRG